MLNGTLCFFIITVPLHHQEQAELSNSRGWQRSVLLRLQLGSHSGGSTLSFYECYYAYRKEQDVNSGMNDELPSVLFCIYIQFQYKMWLCVHYLPPVYYITYESEQCVWQRMFPDPLSKDTYSTWATAGRSHYFIASQFTLFFPTQQPTQQW